MDTTTATEYSDKEWTYVGRRVDRDGKVMHRWLMHNGEIGHYTKGTALSVGSIYLVNCNEDGSKASPKGARFVRQEGAPDEATLARWRAEDKAAYLEIEGVKAERKAKADNGDIGSLTLVEFRRMMRDGGTIRRGALLAMLLGYVDG